MAILAFQKPDKVVMLEANDHFGKFEFRPLEPGFGVTIGNALRRILLSSLEGYAINTIRIAGVDHEFSSVPGVKEDVTNIILNLKQVRFKQVVEEFENEKVSITVENSTEFKAGDIGKYLTGFEVLNPDLVICHLDSKASMQIVGKFEFRPLEPGFGVTIGNALRRILLSSLEGYAINTIRIAGVDHEFSSVPGVKEDVTNIILNLKQVRFKQVVEEFENEKVSITVENSTEFKAGDIGKYLTGFEVLNPDLVICHLDSKASMQIDLSINKGRGYVQAEENRQYCLDVNVLPIDSIYTPIRNVKYAVEPFRVEQKTDYDKLVLEVTTDGSISPKDALKEAAKILIYHFMLFSDEKITLESPDTEQNQEFDEEVLHMRQLLKTRLVDMNLSVRALNCLKAADVETLGDLVQYNKTDLLKFRNFGKKSLSELDDLLEGLNLTFGTDITKYKLDKE